MARPCGRKRNARRESARVGAAWWGGANLVYFPPTTSELEEVTVLSEQGWGDWRVAGGVGGRGD